MSMKYTALWFNEETGGIGIGSQPCDTFDEAADAAADRVQRRSRLAWVALLPADKSYRDMTPDDMEVAS